MCTSGIIIEPMDVDAHLELSGAPSQKDGFIARKHYMSSRLTNAKDRKWTEGFAVLQKSKLNLYQFVNKKRSMKGAWAGLIRV